MKPIVLATDGCHEGGTMKPILLATDGSPSAEAATLEAIELAQAFDAPLLVASVAHVVLPAYSGYYGYGEIAVDLHKAELKHVGEVLATTKARVERANVPCETIALDGIAAEQITRVARERDARLVVVGAHGWGRVGRLIHGSVSTAVLHDAPCPVLVVHGSAEPLVEAAPAPLAAVAH
jgi:nucleotide-binding universal stress UspA family protein